MTTAIAAPSARSFDWKRFPEAESFLDDQVRAALAGNAFAARLARRMKEETSTRFVAWVDHLVLTHRPGLERELAALGFVREPATYAVGVPVFGHEGGMFPRLAVVPGAGPAVREVAIKAE